MSEDLCGKFESDEFYKQFLKGDQNVTLASLSISEQIKKLSEGLDTISAELHSQVRKEHGALLSQASHAGKLYTALESVSGHMDRIQTSANRLRSQVRTQYDMIENQTLVLGRLHEASHILRSCANMLHLTKKLKNTRDPNEQATLLFELEPFMEDEDVGRIEFVQEDRAFIAATRQKLNNTSQLDLINGLKERNEEKVTKSLQIFVNLQTVSKCLNNLVETFINEIAQSLKDCFAGTDVSTLKPQSQQEPRESTRTLGSLKGPGKTPTLTTSQHFRSKLWKSLHWLIYDEIGDYCEQVILLKHCFDNVQILCTNTLVEDVKKKFWERVENLFRTSFSDCSPHISQCLQEGLPKLLSAARGLQSKLDSAFVFSDDIFEPLESGYLSKCGGTLKSCLTGIDLPSTDTIDNYIRTATAELSAAMVDNRLSNLVAGAFNACNMDFWNKIEVQIKLGTDSKQVVDIPNVAQIQNTNLANLVFYHSEAVKRMVTNLGNTFAKSSAAENITENLTKGQNLVLAILQQLMDSMTSTAGIILLSMHREPGLNGDKLSVAGPSLYMKEFQDFVQRCWTYHISPFSDKDTISKCGEQFACRCIDIFVNNLAILRPLSAAGRMRLKNDCTHLETALKPVVGNLANLGKPFRLLRAISTLITQQPEVLVQQEIENEAPVPPHIILFLLFSHAGSDLQSPHTAANWSNEHLIQWLEGHTSEKERLELVAGALQRYRDMVRRKNSTRYDPVYPQLASYFEKAYKAIS